MKHRWSLLIIETVGHAEDLGPNTCRPRLRG